LEDTATLWLQRQGMVMVGTARDEITMEHSFILRHDDARLRLERLAAADVLLWRTYSPTLATVTVKGISVQTGEVLFTGVASVTGPITYRDATDRYYHRYDIDGVMLRALTCQALATAFRLRPAGVRDVAPEAAC
jgi:hypothetical protein